MKIKGHYWDILALALGAFTALVYVYYPVRVEAADEARPIDVRLNATTMVASWLLADPNLTQAQVAEILDLAKAHCNQVSTAKLWPSEMTDVERRFDSLRWAYGNWRSGIDASIFNKAWNWSAAGILPWLKETAA